VFALHYKSRLHQIDAAFAALGKRTEIEIRNAV